MREFPHIYPGTGMPSITPRHGKNRPHGEFEIGGSCEKSHKPTSRSSRLWPHIWPCYAVPGAWPCGGDTGGVTSAVRHEAAGLQQPDRRSCGPYGRVLAIRGGGGECEGSFPRKRRLETPFVTSAHGPPPVAIARRVELDVQSRVRLVLDTEASRPGGGPVLTAAVILRWLRGRLAPRTPTCIAARNVFTVFVTVVVIESGPLITPIRGVI